MDALKRLEIYLDVIKSKISEDEYNKMLTEIDVIYEWLKIDKERDSKLMDSVENSESKSDSEEFICGDHSCPCEPHKVQVSDSSESDKEYEEFVCKDPGCYCKNI
jgi:hypothetical protein